MSAASKGPASFFLTFAAAAAAVVVATLCPSASAVGPRAVIDKTTCVAAAEWMRDASLNYRPAIYWTPARVHTLLESMWSPGGQDVEQACDDFFYCVLECASDKRKDGTLRVSDAAAIDLCAAEFVTADFDAVVQKYEAQGKDIFDAVQRTKPCSRGSDAYNERHTPSIPGVDLPWDDDEFFDGPQQTGGEPGKRRRRRGRGRGRAHRADNEEFLAADF